MNQIYNPYQNYKKQQTQEVQTADRVKLLVMLIEGAICFNKKAIIAHDENHDRINALQLADRGAKIVAHLYQSLDMNQEGELLNQLTSLYSFMLDCYAKYSKADGQTNHLTSINNILDTLLVAWKKIESGEIDWKKDLENGKS